MKKYFTVATAVVFTLGLSATMQAQVGMTNNTPDKSAALDMKATNNKGLLIPNVSLTSIVDKTPIAGGNPAQSLLVYNTNGSITGVGAGGTGYYYWDTNIWKKLMSKLEVPNNSNSITSPNSTISINGSANVLSATTIDIKAGENAQVLTTNGSRQVVWASQEEMTGGISFVAQNGLGGGNTPLPLGVETDVSDGGITVSVSRPSTVVISGRIIIGIYSEEAAGAGYVRIANKATGLTVNGYTGSVPYSIVSPTAGASNKNFAVVTFETSIDIDAPGSYTFAIYARADWTKSTKVGGTVTNNGSHSLNVSGTPWPVTGGGSSNSSYRVTVYNK